MLGAMPLSRPKPPQTGAEGQPLQGHSSQRQLPPKVSGPPLAAPSTPSRRAESTASACEIHPLKIQKSHNYRRLRDVRLPETSTSNILISAAEVTGVPVRVLGYFDSNRACLLSIVSKDDDACSLICKGKPPILIRHLTLA